LAAAPSFALTIARLRVAFAEGTALRAHAWLTLLFIASRLLLYRAGLRMNLVLEWMWLADPTDLRERFWHTLFYFHAMPPGMNALTAVLLKLGGAEVATLALVVFATFSLVLANALFYLGRTLGLAPVVALCLALAFSLSPPALYFDHLYIYESPVVSLVGLSAALFLAAQRAPSFRRWLGFFLCCAILGLIRSTFHWVWFVAVVALSGYFSAREARRTLLLAALAPALLLLSLYLKNWVVFGFFGAFSESPLNLNLVTTHELPRDERNAWIAQGKLSRFAAVDVFAGPRAYLPFFPTSENPAFPPELSRLDRPTNGAPNYNHWFYLQAMPERRKDALVCLRERPGAYLDTIGKGFRDLFSPTTRWHPGDRIHAPTPHDQHRSILGGYENAYNALLHHFPFSPVGWYGFLPVLLVWTVLHTATLRRGADAESRARGAFLCFALFQLAYVIAASTLFSFKESARYRYQIEPLLWLLAALAVTRAVRRYAMTIRQPRS